MPVETFGLWANKGGVGKSTLCFHISTTYGYLYPEKTVIVVDMCPQANLSHTLLTYTDREGTVSESPRTAGPGAGGTPPAMPWRRARRRHARLLLPGALLRLCPTSCRVRRQGIGSGGPAEDWRGIPGHAPAACAAHRGRLPARLAEAVWRREQAQA